MRAGAGSVATLFPLLLAGLLVGMTYWLDIASRAPDSASDGKSRHDPDYIVEHFTVQRHGPEGGLQYTLQASGLQHYPDDDTTLVDAPMLIWHRDPVARIAAREAWFDGKGEHVRLVGDVRMVRAGVDDRPESTMTTARLDVWPDEERASTDGPVALVQGRSRIAGSRLQADNKTANYVLGGPVVGVFHRVAAPATKPRAESRAKSPTGKPKSRSPKTRPKAKR